MLKTTSQQMYFFSSFRVLVKWAQTSISLCKHAFQNLGLQLMSSSRQLPFQNFYRFVLWYTLLELVVVVPHNGFLRVCYECLL